MIKRTRLSRFILINILVSAVTTLTILWIWERAHPRLEPFIPAEGEQTAPLSPSQDAQVDGEPVTEAGLELSNENIDINIRTIVGAGDQQVEYVEIINQGDDPADLTAWQLTDEDGNRFTFPVLILNSGGAIKVLSRTGTNTVIELYWQADAPIWQPGETAQLLNAAGELVASYSIP